MSSNALATAIPIAMNGDQPLPAEITSEALTQIEKHVAAMSCETTEQAEMLSMFLNNIVASREKAIAAWFKPLKSAAKAMHQLFCDRERDALAPLVKARAAGNAKIGAWKRAEEERRQAAIRLAEEQAKRDAERLQVEQAEALAMAGREAEAVALIAAPAETVMPVFQAEAPKLQGSSFRRYWKAEIEDLVKLVLWVAENPEDRIQYVAPNESALSELARQREDKLKIPGVRAVYEDRVQQTGRR